MPSAFAYYRLPHADHYVRIEGEAQELPNSTALNGRSGFVLAPFNITPDQPLLLIRPDKMESTPCRRLLRKDAIAPGEESPDSSSTKNQGLQSNQFPLPSDGLLSPLRGTEGGFYYSIDFANFHSQLLTGAFRKIVLARQADEETADAIPPLTLFHRACQYYPRMFVALVFTPQSGYWLTATPEILLEGHDRDWRTIALAGTVILAGDQLDGEGETVTWSTKNIEEQRVVSTYIAECLEQFTSDFREEGPRTVRAANLVHLRSDFTFVLPEDRHIGELLGRLHPTPAVCGLPKREAFNFIIRNEHTPRRYYSGFMGPLNIQPAGDAGSSTHLYVSLRCMNIEGNRYHLYAGGGLLKESTDEQEWQETEAKLETMRALLHESRGQVRDSVQNQATCPHDSPHDSQTPNTRV